MATADELLAMAETLRRAIASGHKRVTYADKTVEYRDMREMREALAVINQQLSAAQSTAVVRGYRFASEKGL